MALWEQLTVTVFRRLFTDRSLSPTDVRVFGILWQTPGLTPHSSARTSRVLSPETFRRSAKRLLENGWGYSVPLSNGNAVIPWMPLEVEEEVVSLVSEIREGVAFRGEWLMRCLLDLIVRQSGYIDNARPEWLVSGDGSGRLELDRLYVSANVAFEFQGAQHYRTGTPFTSTDAELQKRMQVDKLKAELCEAEGIHLIHVMAAALDFDPIRTKIKGWLPIIPLPNDTPLIRYISRQCRSYRNYAARTENWE